MPVDALRRQGLLIQAIRDNDPVIFCEHKNLYGFWRATFRGELRDPVRRGNVVRDGRQVSIVTYGLMVQPARSDACRGAGEGGRRGRGDRPALAEPADIDTVLESVEKTGRLVCVDEANPRCSIAADVSAQVAQQAFGALKGPIEMVTPPHVPVPFAGARGPVHPERGADRAAVKRTMAGGKH